MPTDQGLMRVSLMARKAAHRQTAAELLTGDRGGQGPEQGRADGSSDGRRGAKWERGRGGVTATSTHCHPEGPGPQSVSFVWPHRILPTPALTFPLVNSHCLSSLLRASVPRVTSTLHMPPTGALSSWPVSFLPTHWVKLSSGFCVHARMSPPPG